MPLHIALVHYPTVDRTGRAVCTSVTNLDLHDLSRAGTTYGVDGVWIVHPYPAQQRFLQRVLRHWTDGWGAQYNHTRKESLAVTELADDLGEVRRRIEAREGRPVAFVGTSARPSGQPVGFGDLRRRMEENPEQSYCLVFGTGWGLHPEVMEEMDLVLEPVYGPGKWNHLSVRAAVAIILDRLRGAGNPLTEQKPACIRLGKQPTLGSENT